MKLTHRPLAAAVATLVLFGGFGCSENTLDAFEPEITNDPGSFQLQATGVENTSLTRDWDWENSKPEADVNRSGAVRAGSATLTLLDGAGTSVFTGDLAETGTTQTFSGTAGTWTIRLDLEGFDGDLNFRVETP